MRSTFSLLLVFLFFSLSFSQWSVNPAGGSIRARDSMRVDSLRNTTAIGADANGKFFKSDSIPKSDLSHKAHTTAAGTVDTNLLAVSATDSSFKKLTRAQLQAAVDSVRASSKADRADSAGVAGKAWATPSDNKLLFSTPTGRIDTTNAKYDPNYGDIFFPRNFYLGDTTTSGVMYYSGALSRISDLGYDSNAILYGVTGTTRGPRLTLFGDQFYAYPGYAMLFAGDSGGVIVDAPKKGIILDARREGKVFVASNYTSFLGPNKTIPPGDTAEEPDSSVMIVVDETGDTTSSISSRGRYLSLYGHSERDSGLFIGRNGTIVNGNLKVNKAPIVTSAPYFYVSGSGADSNKVRRMAAGSIATSDSARVAGKAYSLKHSGTIGTLAKFGTDSTLVNSHFSESGDTSAAISIKTGIGVSIPKYMLDVEPASGINAVAKFGANAPIYLNNSNPAVGFNCSWSSSRSRWEFGKTNAGGYGAIVRHRANNGIFTIRTSSDSGTIDSAVNLVDRITIDKVGKVVIGSDSNQLVVENTKTTVNGSLELKKATIANSSNYVYVSGTGADSNKVKRLRTYGIQDTTYRSYGGLDFSQSGTGRILGVYSPYPGTPANMLPVPIAYNGWYYQSFNLMTGRTTLSDDHRCGLGEHTNELIFRKCDEPTAWVLSHDENMFSLGFTDTGDAKDSANVIGDTTILSVSKTNVKIGTIDFPDSSRMYTDNQVHVNDSGFRIITNVPASSNSELTLKIFGRTPGYPCDATAEFAINNDPDYININFWGYGGPTKIYAYSSGGFVNFWFDKLESSGFYAGYLLTLIGDNKGIKYTVVDTLKPSFTVSAPYPDSGSLYDFRTKKVDTLSRLTKMYHVASVQSSGLSSTGNIKDSGNTITLTGAIFKNSLPQYQNHSNGYLIKTDIKKTRCTSMYIKIWGKHGSNAVDCIASGYFDGTFLVNHRLSGAFTGIDTVFVTSRDSLEFWVGPQPSGTGNLAMLSFELTCDTTFKILNVKDSTYNHGSPSEYVFRIVN